MLALVLLVGMHGRESWTARKAEKENRQFQDVALNTYVEDTKDSETN